MKILAVRRPWPYLIDGNHKTIEVRSTPTGFRGYLGLYNSLSKPDPDEYDYFRYELGFDVSVDDLVFGEITSLIEIKDCIKLDTLEIFMSYQLEHCLDVRHFRPGLYGWVIGDVIPLPRTVPFKMPKGCVIFANVPDELILDTGVVIPDVPATT
ncbi:hypothetical protein [Methanolobus sp. WCC4]|uniref:hypothetical protein n=1 Tax=Methanolobus sp. WCC4 TaxID=3125784 RepID=UPI0030F8FC15